MMIIAVGEVLIDHFPDYQRVGGAPLNFALHLKKLGLAVRLMTRIGDDADGRRIQRLLDRHGFNPADLQVDPRRPTGAVDVTLDAAGIPTFDILPDAAYDFLQLDQTPAQAVADDPALVYYGSLIQRSASGAGQVGRFLRRCSPGTKRFCDINLRAPHYSRETILQSLQFADILKLNEDELAEIRDCLDKPASLERFAEYLMSAFKIEMLAITRGAAGSTLITEYQSIDSPPPRSETVVDTVGAGDGFAAILVHGVLQGLPLETIAATANAFAASICRYPGAVVEDDHFYSSWIDRIGGKP
jgi:fructokinase